MRWYVAVIIITILGISGQAWALKATTVENICACHNRGDVEDMVRFANAGDEDSFGAYVRAGKCITMRGGIDVTVTETTFGGYSEFVFRGLKLWTIRHGLENYR